MHGSFLPPSTATPNRRPRQSQFPRRRLIPTYPPSFYLYRRRLSHTDRYRGDGSLSLPKKLSYLVKIPLPVFNSHTITTLTPGDDYTSGVVDPTYTYIYLASDSPSDDGYILRV